MEVKFTLVRKMKNLEKFQVTEAFEKDRSSMEQVGKAMSSYGYQSGIALLVLFEMPIWIFLFPLSYLGSFRESALEEKIFGYQKAIKVISRQIIIINSAEWRLDSITVRSYWVHARQII